MKTVHDEAFLAYGKVLEGYDTAPLVDALLATTPCPTDSTVYVPSEPALESLPLFATLRDNVYGGMPIQLGYCNGVNTMLNCLEYHRDSEVNVAANDVVLLVARMQDIRDGMLDTSLVQAFTLPAGCAVQCYETTLHYAPASTAGGFRVAVVLPRGTNTEKPSITTQSREDKLLWARNKWLLAHPDSGEARQGAYVGLTGKNIDLND